jgi:hypothetical protein
MISPRRLSKTFRDYQKEEPYYVRIIDILKIRTESTRESCYKCDLFPPSDLKSFITKGNASDMIREVLDWRGIEIHPKATKSFLGHVICIRCLAALLISDDPISSLRATNKHPPELSDTDSEFSTARSAFSSDISENDLADSRVSIEKVKFLESDGEEREMGRKIK